MGKSNKFDYSKRGSSGAKLGQIVARDLKKEAERAQKDADKAASKTRKRSTDSSGGGGSTPGDGSRDGVSLDMQIPLKELGDEGACAMADELEIALSQGLVLLEDVNLSGNGITVVTLARLAPIIKLARHDLKTLNLAGNNIKVESAEEAVQWETFLQSFSDCFKLRRLDLSGNFNLGPSAFEILARVHVNEPAIDPLGWRGETSVISLHSHEEFVASTEASSSIDRMTDGALIKRRTGLRSIAYITLTDTGLNDLSAMWLSFILENHHYPNQLIDGLNAISTTSNIASYQQNARSRGVDWDMKAANQNRDGLFLLQKAESFREQVMLADEDIEDLPEDSHVSHNAKEQADVIQPASRRNSRALPGDRRASIRSIRTVDGGEHELSELESARKRLQRSIITKYGASRVELWSTALRLVISSRILVGLGPQDGRSEAYYTGPPKFDFTNYSPVIIIDRKGLDPRPLTPLRVSEPAPILLSSPPRQGTYAATLTAKNTAFLGEQDLKISEGTNIPRSPKVVLKPQRKYASNEDVEATEKVVGLVVRHRSPHRFVQWQEARTKKHEEEAKPFRDSKIPSHLPKHLVDLIAGCTVSGRGRRLLSDRQLQAALSWGQQRAKFQTEKEWRRMADSSQTWSLLESIRCLAYHRQ